jgi:hypothetical protein
VILFFLRYFRPIVVLVIRVLLHYSRHIYAQQTHTTALKIRKILI